MSELEECKQERDEAFKTLNENQAEYDKQLLTLSAAFLGVSLAFIKDVVPLKSATHLWELDAALGLLAACVCLVLWTFQYSIHGHLRLAEYWELKEKKLQAQDGEKASIDAKLRLLRDGLENKAVKIKFANWSSGGLFLVGTVLLVVFVTTNVHREAGLAQKEQLNEGQVIKVPVADDLQRGAHLKVPAQSPAPQDSQTPAQPQTGGTADDRK